MKVIQAGPLGAVVIPPESSPPVRDVVLLHGFGAPGTDLVGLHQGIATSVPTRFIFLQAPHTLNGESGPHAGRAWWHIDMIALQVARMTGQHEALAVQTPEGIAEARAALAESLDALEKALGLQIERTVLGGFSQGAMLSCDFSLRAERSPEALIQLSGTVICEAEWKPLMTARSNLRVFQSHSPDDTVLPFVLAERLRDDFLEAGVDVDFLTFRGGHGIAPEVLRRLSGFLEAL